MGIPQPFAAGVDPAMARNIAAGRSMPPIAAANGTTAARRSDSSPMASSRFTSRPISRKKMVIRPSFTTADSGCPATSRAQKDA